MAKDIKVVFKGNKAPSGKNTNIEYMISTSRLKQLEASKMFDIEMVEKPKAKPKKKTSKKEKK
tara:strand:+ start:28 stop:216 length:189 start_codon:yes stop_codon:yes gene_type:complete